MYLVQPGLLGSASRTTLPARRDQQQAQSGQPEEDNAVYRWAFVREVGLAHERKAESRRNSQRSPDVHLNLQGFDLRAGH